MSLSQNSDRKAFQKELLSYQPQCEEEKAFRERMLFLLENHENCFERSLLHAHFTASAWVVNEARTHCLLTHHAKLDRWLQIGGHADGDPNLYKVCLKEVREESGLYHLKLLSPRIFDIDIHRIPERKAIPAHDHYDVRYLVQADMDEPIRFNHESKNMDWVLLSQVKERSEANDSMIRMVNKTNDFSINKR